MLLILLQSIEVFGNYVPLLPILSLLLDPDIVSNVLPLINVSVPLVLVMLLIPVYLVKLVLITLLEIV